MDPSEEQLREDLELPAFQSGVLLKRWRVVRITWPFAFFAVGAPARDDSPLEYCVRLECTGYRATPPLGTFWNLERETVLEPKDWPKRRDPGKDQSFRTDWQSQNLYIAVDRSALNQHPQWASEAQAQAWRPGCTILVYVQRIYELFNSPRYLGNRCA